MIYWNVILMNEDKSKIIVKQSIFQKRITAILKTLEKFGNIAEDFNTISCRPILSIEIKF